MRRDGVAASLRGMLLHWATGTILYYVSVCVYKYCLGERSRRNNRIENSVWATGQCAAPSHREESQSSLMNIFSSSLLAQRRNSNHAPVIGFFNFCIPPSSLGRGLQLASQRASPLLFPKICSTVGSFSGLILHSL